MDGLRALPLDQAAARLLSMKRMELQKIAKEAGTKANVKNVDIIASLTKALEHWQQRQQQQDHQHKHPVATAADPEPAPAASASPLAESTTDTLMANIQSETAEPLEVAACDSAGSKQPQQALAADLSTVTTAAEPAAATGPLPAPAVAAASPAAAAAAPSTPVPASASNASLATSPAAMLPQPAPTPARQQSADSDLMANARAVAEQVRTASKRPPLTPARTPARRSLAASALGNRLRALGSAASPSRTAMQNGDAAAALQPAFGSPMTAAGMCRDSLAGAASCSLQSFDGSQGRDSVGADAALTAALTSAEPTVSCDLSPGLLTLPGTSAAMSTAAPVAAPAPAAAAMAAAGASDGAAGPAAAEWQGATEAQLREMERAWDEYKAGSPGWRAPSPAAVAAKGAALAAAGFTTVQTPLRSLQFAPPPPARKRAAAGALAGNENAGVNTPRTSTKMGLPAGKLASASRIPPSPASSRKGDAPRATCIPRPSPGNIKGPGRANGPRAASHAASAPAGKDRAKRAEEAFQARRALAAVRASQK